MDIRRRSVDQFRVQLIAKVVYEFQVESSWFSSDLVKLVSAASSMVF